MILQFCFQRDSMKRYRRPLTRTSRTTISIILVPISRIICDIILNASLKSEFHVKNTTVAECILYICTIMRSARLEVKNLQLFIFMRKSSLRSEYIEIDWAHFKKPSLTC